MDGVIESKERKRCRRGRLCREEEEKYLKCVNLPFFVPFFFDTTHASTCSRNVSAPNLFHFHEVKVFIYRWSLKVNIGKNGHQDAEFMVAKERAIGRRYPGTRVPPPVTPPPPPPPPQQPSRLPPPPLWPPPHLRMYIR